MLIGSPGASQRLSQVSTPLEVPSLKTPLDVAVQDQAYDIEVLQEQNVTMASQVALLSDQLAQATQ